MVVSATAHAYTDAAVRHAIDNGVKGIEHGNLISRDTAELCATGTIDYPYRYLLTSCRKMLGWRRKAYFSPQRCHVMAS